MSAVILHLQPALRYAQSPKAPVLLCIDDEQLALPASAHVLASPGYEVIAPNDTADAVVADYEMPGLTGGRFAAHGTGARFF